MKRQFRVFFLFLLFAFSRPSLAQIVNIESARMQSDTTGWMGNANAGFAITQSVEHILEVAIGAHFQYKTEKDLWLILASYDFLKGGDQKYVDNSLIHFRFNRKMNTWLRWEIFAQAQNNLITEMRARILVGTGPRFKILSTKIIRLYAASLAMYEREKENTSPFIKHNDLRSSSYFSFTITPVPNVEIISTTYYQPLFNNISDYRVMNQATLKVKAGKHFSLSVRWNYLHDRFPAGTAPQTTYTFGSGIDFEF